MHQIWSAGQESPSGCETCKLCELRSSLHHTAAGGYWWSIAHCGQEANQLDTYQSLASKLHTGVLWRPEKHFGPGSEPLPHRKWIPRKYLHGKLALKMEHLFKIEWFSVILLFHDGFQWNVYGGKNFMNYFLFCFSSQMEIDLTAHPMST